MYGRDVHKSTATLDFPRKKILDLGEKLGASLHAQPFRSDARPFFSTTHEVCHCLPDASESQLQSSNLFLFQPINLPIIPRTPSRQMIRI
jgi:hypothetical protein